MKTTKLLTIQESREILARIARDENASAADVIHAIIVDAKLAGEYTGEIDGENWKN